MKGMFTYLNMVVFDGFEAAFDLATKPAYERSSILLDAAKEVFSSIFL